jgi:L-threonylcarbamoyladenylate synthase
MNFEEDIKACIEVLTNGETILYPTDTVWGIGCDALNENAVEKVFALKKRPKEKGFIVLLAEPKDVLQYIAAPHPDIIDILAGFDRPTTVVFEGPLGFPENLLNNDGSLAIRIPDEPFCKALLKRFRKPLVSTSANLSGEPGAQTFAMINPEIINGVAYTVKYRQDDSSPRQASRIVRILEDGSLDIIRP